MAERKFSEFNREFEAYRIDYLVGWTGNRNVMISPDNLMKRMLESLMLNVILRNEIGIPGGVPPLNSAGKIPSQFIDANIIGSADTIDTYDLLLALTPMEAPLNSIYFVKDASSDPHVGTGWALYMRIATNGDSGDWQKLADGNSLGIDLSNFISRNDIGAPLGVAGLGSDALVQLHVNRLSDIRSSCNMTT